MLICITILIKGKQFINMRSRGEIGVVGRGQNNIDTVLMHGMLQKIKTFKHTSYTCFFSSCQYSEPIHL